MEVYGVLEGLAVGLGEGHPALWHPRLLQAGLHLLQGELDLNTGQLASAENELKMAAQAVANLAWPAPLSQGQPPHPSSKFVLTVKGGEEEDNLILRKNQFFIH